MANLCQQQLLFLHRQQLPSREVHMLAGLDYVPFYQPGSWSDAGVDWPPRLAGVAIRAFSHQHRLCIRRQVGAAEQRAESLCGLYARIAKRVHISQARHRGDGQHRQDPGALHTASDSEESTTARWLCPRTTFTLVTPSTLSNLPAGTAMGPGPGADPGAGCGNAVDM